MTDSGSQFSSHGSMRLSDSGSAEDVEEYEIRGRREWLLCSFHRDSFPLDVVVLRSALLKNSESLSLQDDFSQTSG